jgi:uncharacterized membrane protein (DUF106 family)
MITKKMIVSEEELYVLRGALAVFKYQMREDAKNDPKRIDLFRAQYKTADLLKDQVEMLLDQFDPKRHNISVPELMKRNGIKSRAK